MKNGHFFLSPFWQRFSIFYKIPTNQSKVLTTLSHTNYSHQKKIVVVPRILHLHLGFLLEISFSSFLLNYSCLWQKGRLQIPAMKCYSHQAFLPFLAYSSIFHPFFHVSMKFSRKKIKKLTTLPPNFSTKRLKIRSGARKNHLRGSNRIHLIRNEFTLTVVLSWVKSSPSRLLGVSLKWIVEVISSVRGLARWKPQSGSDFFFFF